MAQGPTEPPSSLRRGAASGLIAAALFGVSTPLAKLLVPATGPLMLAGLLYLGAGLALSLAAPLRRRNAEAPIRRSDLPVLAGMVLAGGVVGPVLLVVGLARLPGAGAALLLNLEAPFTILLAMVLLREQLARREALGVLAVLGGAAALAWTPGALSGRPLGLACIAGACAAWALDNTLGQRISTRDPVSVARVKTLAAGTVNVALGLLAGEALPSSPSVVGAMVTGAFGYGASIVLHLLAIRSLGAARQAALFATAPFIGALLAVPLLGEPLSPALLAVAALMACGVGLLVSARHAHRHAHAPVEHEHAHVHDSHHQHVHDGPVVEPHSHVHRHAGLVHDHPHAPDIHHRHVH